MVGSPESKRYVEVIIDTAVRDLDRPFTYELPAEISAGVQVGSMALVPFNNRLSLGYVVGFPPRSDLSRIKSVSRIVDEPPLFDFDSMRLCKWIASHYLCPLSRSFHLVVPPGRSRKVKQLVSLAVRARDALIAVAGDDAAVKVVNELNSAGELDIDALKKLIGAGPAVTGVKSMEEKSLVKRRFALTRPAANARTRLVVHATPVASDWNAINKLPGRQREIVDELIARGGVEFQSDLLQSVGASHASLKSLAKKGVLEIAGEEVLRQPWLGASSGGAVRHKPNARQQAAIDRVSTVIEEGRHKVFLLEGVTGSGKTEVYIHSIEKALEKGKQAIVLVPEISLTPQTVERFESRFPGDVAVLHSRLGPGERFDQWRGARDGRYRVVVGARSALFAPLANIGLIVIDEEHEPSYKSDTSPRYNARDVAVVRARMAGAVVILGSATPCLESVERARAGLYERLELPKRIDNRPLPEVEIVDMRETGGAGEVPLLSRRMLDALSRAVEAGDQAILFLNRRGFSNYMQCRACGQIMGCDDCEVSLCYHSRGNMMLCHHCGMRRNVPPACPSCGGGPMKQFGAGTQKVEEELMKHVPGVTCIRMDADSTTTKDAHWRLLGKFRAGEAQVLIGTQMIAKGLDIPSVTFVGVINADTALALPDFRASERTYQLLTQVSGRAGRGLRPGLVVIQTFNPDHPTIKAMTGGTGTFIEAELESRSRANYPPFVDLVNVMVTSPEIAAASRSAERMRHILDTDLDGTGAIILGPAPAPLSRLRGLYRWHILVKSADLDKISDRLITAVGRFYDYSRTFPPGKSVKVSLDVDPVSLL
ncbi:MAG: primosomal protein N' [Candidatus Anoxymicrobium japonicum]|uniref:Replication restart protein PriA n=1 Tax=Candidatus Anoxymicrobium japonicum TaxID=2013648 RepID=A0A2N3G5U3_9ACTN|nr:MAG: primosomal protein N' [Candidatus Anoxymicrobium japonicum]